MQESVISTYLFATLRLGLSLKRQVIGFLDSLVGIRTVQRAADVLQPVLTALTIALHNESYDDDMLAASLALLQMVEEAATVRDRNLEVFPAEMSKLILTLQTLSEGMLSVVDAIELQFSRATSNEILALAVKLDEAASTLADMLLTIGKGL